MIKSLLKILIATILFPGMAIGQEGLIQHLDASIEESLIPTVRELSVFCIMQIINLRIPVDQNL